MKIIEYKKKNGNEYEITLDNETVLNLYDDIIIKYNLLFNKDISNTKIDEIIKENDSLKAYYLSLKYLSKKMRSSLEIEKYLEKKEYSKVIIDKTIKKLTDQKYLDTDKFIISYINDQYHLTNNGPEKIKYNLSKLGIKEDIVIDKDFSEKINKIIDKKLATNQKLTTYALKMNIANYLINLGYTKEMFEEYIDNIEVNDNNLIKKDYQKIYNKYVKKYDSFKLKMVIKEKLYQKGYSIDSINSIDDML